MYKIPNQGVNPNVFYQSIICSYKKDPMTISNSAIANGSKMSFTSN